MTTTLHRVVHASVLLDFAGARILTDPWFAERPGYRHGEPTAYASGADLPELAGVVISHGHHDHCDVAGLAAYRDKAVPIATIAGVGRRLRAAGFTNVVELAPWQTVDFGPVRVTATPARHGVPESTFVLTGDGHSVFFGADTLRIPELDEVARRFDLDLALLPINGLRIRPFNRQVVMDAEQAAELTRALRPRYAVPIHYAFTAGPVGDRLFVRHERLRPDRFADAVAALAPETAVRVLETGVLLTL
ncbi:L-ascorbate metabolism protein UlaG (beta-lactamase superfamily) [Hamadaea flava]|uniref:MBL fold metallo-hydrolase n=1 Tax=Hamadaea flava TaxID=1742688 RepID=A0ABV8LZ82_9ACTN|nr:MBL fold metallo-hydrolase [Hamadaea flava]MCP2321587.1 L-ascorbate metabolism protein UlaG (beta-lactamase superfamily) [Hamadaea flava]